MGRVLHVPRVIASVLAAALLVAAVAGIAWAVGSITKGRGTQQVATYHVVLPLNGGERTVTWPVGRAMAAITASSVPDNGCNLFGIHGLVVRNVGPDPIIVVPGESAAEVGAELLAPGGETLAGAAGRVGGVYCVPGSQDQPNPVGGVGIFGIVDEGGGSANGIFSWSFRYNAADETGHFSFTLNVKG